MLYAIHLYGILINLDVMCSPNSHFISESIVSYLGLTRSYRCSYGSDLQSQILLL
jgi:hypothetical protein